MNQFTTATSTTSNVWMFSGEPGAGKTYVTKALMQTRLRVNGTDALVVAYQAKSATPLGGCTIHSTFGISTTGRCDTSDVSQLTKLPNWSNIGILIIEKFAMISPWLLRTMDEKLRRARNLDTFCGGLVVLALGDAMQIPPIQQNSIYEYMLASFDEFRQYVLPQSNAATLADVLYVQAYFNLTTISCVWLKNQMRTIDKQRQRVIRVACNPYESHPMR